MANLISKNYYKDFISVIQQKMDAGGYEGIVWFGYNDSLSLICDLLFADGYSVITVLDNDKNKWGGI